MTAQGALSARGYDGARDAWPEGKRRAVPRVPILSGGAFLARQRETIPCVLQANHVRLLPAGRLALAQALRVSGVGEGDHVLVPAYHCPAMIGPILHLGAQPVFYRLRPDLQVDLDHLQRCMKGAVSALIAVHYFGFPQDLAVLRALCDERGMMLIEDCAHAFFGAFSGQAVGTMGDYAIASAMKFFPVYDGGCLVSNRHALDGVALRAPGWHSGAKAAVNMMERALAFDRGGIAAPALRAAMAAKDGVWSAMKARAAASGAGDRAVATAAAELSEGDDASIEADWLDCRASLPSRMVLAGASRGRIVARRRTNFQRMLEAFRDLPGCRPLHRALPAGVVPWVFPLVFDDVDGAYRDLDRQGIPIPHFGKHLWPGLDPALCPVTMDMARRCLQLPCHQELTDRELNWLIGRVAATMRARNAAG